VSPARALQAPPAPVPPPGEGPRLRIAFLDSWKRSASEGSGTAVAIHLLAQGLQALGHEVHRPGLTSGSGPFLLERLRFNLTLGRALQRTGPHDLVVGFDVDGTLARPSAPFVVSLKGIAADEARFEEGASRLLLSVLARMEASNARRARRVVVPSRYSAEVAVREYGLRPDRLRVVPEPLDPEPWERLHRADHPRPAHPTILSVARQYPRKDTATLLRAMPTLLERVPTARLRVIGGGPELERLRALRHALGLNDRIRLDGPVSDNGEVRRAYMEAHVFCLPSRQEGFGIVLTEAMAAGLPVVAALAGAVPEVVTDGVTGLLVPPGDVDALARALGHLLTHPDRARDMGLQGRRWIHRLRPAAVAQRFLDASLG
jgi:glycosyltransferase involved in cell wall biosynthesis